MRRHLVQGPGALARSPDRAGGAGAGGGTGLAGGGAGTVGGFIGLKQRQRPELRRHEGHCQRPAQHRILVAWITLQRDLVLVFVEIVGKRFRRKARCELQFGNSLVILTSII